MKVPRSFFTLALLSLMFLGLFVLGMPIAGFAETPHSCPGAPAAHLPSSLGVVAQFDFALAKICFPDSSGAIKWQANIYDATAPNSPAICTLPLQDVPAGGTQSFPCYPATPPNLPTAVSVIITYKTSTYGAWMVHEDDATNM